MHGGPGETLSFDGFSLCVQNYYRYKHFSSTRNFKLIELFLATSIQFKKDYSSTNKIYRNFVSYTMFLIQNR